MKMLYRLVAGVAMLGAAYQSIGAQQVPDSSHEPRFSMEEVIAGIEGEAAQRVRVRHSGATLNVIMIPHREAGGVRYRCGPAWLVWHNGEAPSIDDELSFLTMTDLVVADAPSDSGELPAPRRWVLEGPAVKDWTFQVEATSGTRFGGTTSQCPMVSTPVDPEALATPLAIWWSFAKVAEFHGRAKQGLEIALAVFSHQRAMRTNPEVDAEALAIAASLERKANAWLLQPVVVAPPYGNPYIAWIEWMDARQAVLRVTGQIKRADIVVGDMTASLHAAGLSRLEGLVGARISRGSPDFTSLCWTPCWLVDAGEIGAAEARLQKMQLQVFDELLREVKRLPECEKAFTVEASKRLRVLVGQFPNGCRVTDTMRDILKSRMDMFCAQGKFTSEPTIITDFAMMMALEIWTAAWNADDALGRDAQAARTAWRAELRRMLEQGLLEEPLLSRIDPSFRGAVLVETMRILESHLDLSGNYLGAFPPGPRMPEIVKAHWRHILSERNQNGLVDAVSRYNEFLEEKDVLDHEGLDPEGVDHEGDAMREAYLKRAAIENMGGLLFMDLLEALYMSCCESAAPKDYPEPFPMMYASFSAGRKRANWRIGWN